MFSKLNIKARLTSLFVAIFGSTLVVFGILTFNFLSQSLLKEFDDALYNYAVDVSESVVLNPAGNLAVSSANVDQTKVYPFSLGTALIQIRQMSGTVLSQVGNFGKFQMPFRSDFERLSQGEDVTYRTVTKLEGLPDAEAQSYRIINFPLDSSTVPQLILQIAVPLTFVEAQISRRRILFETGIPLVILISMLAGFFLASRALAPVQEIILKAHNIGVHDLRERLPVPAAHDEVQSLALTLNEMLSRIEMAFQSHERFVADASHQLLTPLTIMKSEIEQTLKSGDLQTSINTLTSAQQEVDHLIALVKNLLLLARVDAGLGAMKLQDLYFEEVVLDAISRAEKLARAKDIRLKFNIQTQSQDVRPKIKGDEDLLQNLVFNLIENAIKYSEPSQQVSVSLQWSSPWQILKIEDSGPGVPEDSLEKIFERFSRAQNVGKRQGYGLGLAIAKQIAIIHGAELTAHNRPKAILGSSEGSSGALFELKIKNI